MIRWVVVAAGVLGFLGVLAGAFGAHGLESQLKEQGFEPEVVTDKIKQCETAVRYQMFHVAAILVLGLLGADACSKKRKLAVGFFLVGIALFSGGLYSMVFLDLIGHWAIVPMGGLCFMVGWACVVLIGTGRSQTACEHRSAKGSP